MYSVTLNWPEIEKTLCQTIRYLFPYILVKVNHAVINVLRQVQFFSLSSVAFLQASVTVKQDCEGLPLFKPPSDMIVMADNDSVK